MRWLLNLFALMAVVGFANLGYWQYARYEYKLAVKQQEEIARQQPAVNLMSVTQWPNSLADGFTPVRAVGHWQVDQQFLLDNQSSNVIKVPNQRHGVHVISPLKLADDSFVLINRGWVPYVNGRELEVDLALPTTEVQVQGILRSLPTAGIRLGEVATEQSWPRLVQYPLAAEYASMLNAVVRTGQIELNADQANGFERQWQAVPEAFPPERHMGYAVQWWALMVAAIVICLLLNWRYRTHQSH